MTTAPSPLNAIFTIRLMMAALEGVKANLPVENIGFPFTSRLTFNSIHPGVLLVTGSFEAFLRFSVQAAPTRIDLLEDSSCARIITISEYIRSFGFALTDARV